MKYSYFILLAFFLNIFATHQVIGYAHTKPNPLPLQEAEFITQWAQYNLPQEGILTEGKDGFVYLKVDNSYIFRLFPMFSDSSYAIPSYFRRSDSPGAHISIFYVDERNRTGAIKEIGQKYSFKITGLAAVPQKTHKYIVLEVTSPELEHLRQRYGLSPLLKGNAFHITIAKKKERH